MEQLFLFFFENSCFRAISGVIIAAFLAILLIYAEVRLYAEARIGRTGEGLGRTGGQRANRPVTRATQWRLHKERRASVAHNRKKGEEKEKEGRQERRTEEEKAKGREAEQGRETDMKKAAPK